MPAHRRPPPCPAKIPLQIDIPQKELETVEAGGDFKQVSLHTIHSDALIHANDSVVNLDLETGHLDHNITLDGSDSNTFKSVSVYFDEFPDNISMELNLIPGGAINDPQGILEENGSASESGRPVISIGHTKEISIYCTE